jgi:hypothetical protein
MGLASRGLRDLDNGPERIDDGAELAAVRTQARRVLVQSLLATLVATAVMGLPGPWAP